MGEAGEGLLVRKIKEGTVIDHIPAGRALAVLKILGITGREGLKVALVMNVESRKLGRKDIVKVEGRLLSPHEVDVIALIAPTATINIIKDYRVVEKRHVRLPRLVEGVLRCKNPTCITRKKGEFIRSRFRLVSEKPVVLQCVYCGTLLREEEIVSQILGG